MTDNSNSSIGADLSNALKAKGMLGGIQTIYMRIRQTKIASYLLTKDNWLEQHHRVNLNLLFMILNILFHSGRN